MIRDFFKRLFGKQESVQSDTLSPVSTVLVVSEPVVEQQKPMTKKPRVAKSKPVKEVVVHQTAWPFEEPVVSKSSAKRTKKSAASGEYAPVPAAMTASKKKTAPKSKNNQSKNSVPVAPNKRSRTKKNV